MGQRVDTRGDLQWLADWIRKLKIEQGIGVVELAEKVGEEHARISQLKNPKKYKKPPGYELFWRLMAVYHDEEENAAMSSDAIRASIFRVIASIGPARMTYLEHLSSSEAQALIDEHERKRSARRRLESLDAPKDEPPERM